MGRSGSRSRANAHLRRKERAEDGAPGCVRPPEVDGVVAARGLVTLEADWHGRTLNGCGGLGAAITPRDTNLG